MGGQKRRGKTKTNLHFRRASKRQDAGLRSHAFARLCCPDNSLISAPRRRAMGQDEDTAPRHNHLFPQTPPFHLSVLRSLVHTERLAEELHHVHDLIGGVRGGSGSDTMLISHGGARDSLRLDVHRQHEHISLSFEESRGRCRTAAAAAAAAATPQRQENTCSGNWRDVMPLRLDASRTTAEPTHQKTKSEATAPLLPQNRQAQEQHRPTTAVMSTGERERNKTKTFSFTALVAPPPLFSSFPLHPFLSLSLHPQHSLASRTCCCTRGVRALWEEPGGGDGHRRRKEKQ